MKKIFLVTLTALACTGILTGCGQRDSAVKPTREQAANYVAQSPARLLQGHYMEQDEAYNRLCSGENASSTGCASLKRSLGEYQEALAKVTGYRTARR